MTLTSAELTAMRAVQAAALPDSCTIKRETYSTNTAGGQNLSSTATQASVACAVHVATRESERVLGGRYTDVPQYVFVIPHGTSYAMSDYVYYDSQRYDIVGVLEDGAWATAIRLVTVRHTP